MRRRRYLMGVGSGITVVSVPTIRDGLSPEDVTVRILETNDPVEAGDPLEGILVIENAGTDPVRPAIDFLIGDERQFTWERTVAPGTTETHAFYHPTYPVATDVTFPLRAESEYGSTERIVEVFGIDDLEDARVRPDRAEVAVQPGTTVLFEVGEWGQWWSGGRQVFDGVAPIWEQQYFEATGALYWRESFEQAGSHDVIAVVDGEDGNYRVPWSVDVTPDGAQAPSIDAVTPAADSVELAYGETATFDLEAVGTDADLSRAVWWLGHADRLLEVSSLEGTEATATLSVDADTLCHRCPLIVWVVDENGAMVEISWEISLVEPNGLEVAITETNAPVAAGEFLEVTTRVENTGTEEGSETIRLEVGGEVVDTASVTLAAGESTTVGLGYETYSVRRTVEFPVTVSSPDDTDERVVTVFGTESQ
ncbi:CARDB domain-containing protein [Natrialbaceae archaeon A-gly3]